MKGQLFSWRHAILESELPSTTRHVLLTLSCHMSDAGDSCFPSTRKLSRETGLSERAVITHLKKAKAAGWLKVGLHGFGDRRWRSHEYTVSIPQGTEPDSAPFPHEALNEVQHENREGAERGSAPQGHDALNEVQYPKRRGTEPDDIGALNEVQSNSTENSTGLNTTAYSDEKASPKQRTRFDYPEEFEQAFRALPKRNGDNPKRRAYRAWTARRRDGHSPDVMLAGARRYAEWCRATGKTNTELVKQAATFFGPDEPFLNNWDIPEEVPHGTAHSRKPAQKPLSPGEQIRREAEELAADNARVVN